MTTTDRETINHGKVCPDCGSDEWHLRGSIKCEQRELAKLRTRVTELDAALFGANSRRIQAEASGQRLASLTIDALIGPPCECKGTGTTVGPGGFELCAKCAAEMASKKVLARAETRASVLETVAIEAAAMLAETNHGGLSWNRKESMRLALEAAGVEIPKQCERCPHPAAPSKPGGDKP